MNYALATNTWDKEEIDAIQRVIASGRFTMGPEVKQFEKAFAKRFGTQFALMVNSGSSANLIGIASLFFKRDKPLQRGDEVIVPAFGWATTYHPLQQYGLRLRFVDIDLETLNLDVSQLEQALTPKTRMLVAVNILGNPCALDTMRDFCDQNNLIFFEDNCESMGATLGGKQCGTFGDIGTFSLFFSHHISTMEGGVLVTDNEELYHIARSLRAHGWTRDLPDESPIYNKGKNDIYEAYRFILPGYNVRPIEFCGAIGIEQLKKLDIILEQRRKNAKLFKQLFENDKRLIIQHENGCSSWFAFTIITRPESGLQRASVFNSLKKTGIGYRTITGGNFPRHDVIKHFDYTCVNELPNANIAQGYGFFVGNHPTDITRQLHLLKRKLNELYTWKPLYSQED